jgi:predicted 3-demethylubiquinone-9 3-methyltransferase (glyoxalase superfamily)
MMDLPGTSSNPIEGINMQKIRLHLTFNNQAEEAANFYVSIFINSQILKITHYGEKEIAALSRLPEDIRPGPVGLAKTVRFQLNGQEFLAANGGPYFKFSEGTSLYVNCETQEEIDELWEKLSNGGEIQECGWLRDKFGVSWQIAPTIMQEMMEDPDPEKSQRVKIALLKMKKIDIETLKQAYK